MKSTDSIPAGQFRDIPVDILRGLAIAIMVGANCVPYLLVTPAPFWLRLTATIAAPLFVFLSGMMVTLSCRIKKYPFSYFLVRGALVIAIAALIDLLAAGLVPFMSFDVLYLIGISLPVTYLFLRLPMKGRIAVFLAILFATPLLQAVIGYSPLVISIPLAAVSGGAALPSFFTVISQLFVEGWFPLFPWVLFALLGAQAGEFRWQDNTIISFAHREMIVLSSSILLTGAAFWFLMPGPFYIRSGYVELFYPPTLEFLVFIVGIIFCLFIVADSLPVRNAVFDPLRAMGECSLAIYIIHSVIIYLFIKPLGIRLPLGLFLAGYLVFLTGMILVAYLLRDIRTGTRTRSLVLRLLIGG
nr:heparan-alpha-glucosaminide N-acetyltransferase domain-containing protein [uncultured Methanoregula sp.]